MKNIMMAVMVSFVGACYASDEARYTLIYKHTEEGLLYQVIGEQEYVLMSHSDFNLIDTKYKPSREQLIHVMGQQTTLISKLNRVAVEAQDIASEAVKQLKIQKLTISALTLINAGLVGYYWYQQWYGTQQNCPLQ